MEPRLAGINTLVEVGELVVAFEMLLDNLLEYDIPLSEEERAGARSLGSVFGVDPKRMGHIDELGFPRTGW